MQVIFYWQSGGGLCYFVVLNILEILESFASTLNGWWALKFQGYELSIRKYFLTEEMSIYCYLRWKTVSCLPLCSVMSVYDKVEEFVSLQWIGSKTLRQRRGFAAWINTFRWYCICFLISVILLQTFFWKDTSLL